METDVLPLNDAPLPAGRQARKLTALGGKFYFFERLMLTTHFAVLLILKLLRNELLIL